MNGKIDSILCVLREEPGKETCKLSIPNKLFNITQGFPQGYGVASQRMCGDRTDTNRLARFFIMKLKWRLEAVKWHQLESSIVMSVFGTFHNSSKQETEMMKSRELGYFQGSNSKVPTVFSNNFTISTISCSFKTEQLDRRNDRCEDQFQKYR